MVQWKQIDAYFHTFSLQYKVISTIIRISKPYSPALWQKASYFTAWFGLIRSKVGQMFSICVLFYSNQFRPRVFIPILQPLNYNVCCSDAASLSFVIPLPSTRDGTGWEWLRCHGRVWSYRWVLDFTSSASSSRIQSIMSRGHGGRYWRAMVDDKGADRDGWAYTARIVVQGQRQSHQC